MGRHRRRPAPSAAGTPDHDDRSGHRHRVRSRPRGRIVPRAARHARTGSVAGADARRPARRPPADRFDAGAGTPTQPDRRCRRRHGRRRSRRPRCRSGRWRACSAGSTRVHRPGRLQAAWRVGRLRSAFVELATDLIGRVDADLSAVPALDELANHELVAILRNGRRTLASLHGHEAIAGLLIPSTATASVTGASLALSAVAQAHAEGVPMAELIERDPVVLALLAPSIGDRTAIADLGIVAEAVARTGGDPRRSRPRRGRPRGPAPAGAVAPGADRPHGVGARPPPRRRRVLPSLRIGAAPHARRAGRCRPGAHRAGRPRCSPRTHRDVPPRPVPPRRRRHGMGGPRSVQPSSSGARCTTEPSGVSTGTAAGSVLVWHDQPRSRRDRSARCWWSAISTHASPRSSRGSGRSSPRRAVRSATSRSSPASTTSRPSSASTGRPRSSTMVSSSPSTAARAPWTSSRRHRRRRRRGRGCNDTTAQQPITVGAPS